MKEFWYIEILNELTMDQLIWLASINDLDQLHTLIAHEMDKRQR